VGNFVDEDRHESFVVLGEEHLRADHHVPVHIGKSVEFAQALAGRRAPFWAQATTGHEFVSGFQGDGAIKWVEKLESLDFLDGDPGGRKVPLREVLDQCALGALIEVLKPFKRGSFVKGLK
jgi:hypothetical protein